MRRIGYLVPEFPGQTHAFFWREMAALERLGIRPELVSTRRPPRGVMSHAWAKEAMGRTTYLMPVTAQTLTGLVWELLKSGPCRWWRCLRAVREAEGVSLGGRLRLTVLMLFGAQLARLARRRGWEHIHIHSAADGAHLGLFAWLLSDIPYSLTLHGHLGDYGPNQKQKWEHARFGITITNRLRGELRKTIGAPHPPLDVAPMGVELSRFERAASYRAWNQSGRCVVFSCGRLNVCKAFDVLVAAVGRLRAQGLDVELRIAGEDDAGGTGYRRIIEKKIADEGLCDHVTLLGAISEEEVRRELEAAHLFVLPSRHEALGVATMEAMALRLPVISTRTGGISELVSDGEDGLLVAPDDVAELAAAMEQVLRSPQLALRFSAAGREKIARSFHSGVSAEALFRRLGGSENPMFEAPAAPHATVAGGTP